MKRTNHILRIKNLFKGLLAGPVVNLLLFGAVFFFLLYKGQKKWMVKPSYID